MTLEQKNEKSGGVSEKTGSLKETVIGRFYAERKENGTSAPVIRWRADFILTPAVAACHFRNPLKIPFPRLKMENRILQEVN